MSENRVVRGDFKQEIFNKVSENVKALEALFPAVVKDGQVDFEALKEELGQFEEVGPEKYGLTWAGKQNAKKIAQQDIVGKTLKFIPEESKDAKTTENLYIEGDNLEVLKLLRENYYGAIKMIYIDPPYNTGNDFIYNDKFSMSNSESDYLENNISNNGEKLILNQKSDNKYHANWLNMMYPRLKVAKDLLKDDGVIFISIDDNELENLKKICDEIFGVQRYQATITYVRKTSGKQDSSNFVKSTEYILVYSKSDAWKSNRLVASEKVTDRYNKVDESTGIAYREVDLRKTGSGDRFEDRPSMYYPFYYHEETKELIPSEKYNKEYVDNGYIEIYPIKADGTKGRWRWGIDTAINNIDILIPKVMQKYNNKWTIYEKDFINKKGDVRTVAEHTAWDKTEFNSDNAMNDFKSLGFSNQDFPFPKSVALISHMIFLGTSTNDIILDFFSGSATTAQAVINQNMLDSGNRKFILVQLPEACDESSNAYKSGYKNICAIGKERINRVRKKVREEALEQGIDIGYKVFRVSDTNIRWNYEDIKAQRCNLIQQETQLEIAATKCKDLEQIDIATSLRGDKDQLDFMPEIKDIDVVYELLLRQRDIPLSAKVELLSEIGERTYLFAQSYLVCLETEITNELIEKIAAITPLPIKFIFRDSAFEDDINLKDETIRRFKALVERNTGKQQKAYTVEFI